MTIGLPFIRTSPAHGTAFNKKIFGMLFVVNNTKMIIATRHIPLKNVPKMITQALITSTVKLTHHALKLHFKISNPQIAICGLNPHAGEGGRIGNEETKIIIPALVKLKKQSINVQGPFPADTLFMSTNAKRYDALIAMYHDQGLGPLKTTHFNKLVNMTIGLPFIRTSPAHGTAFNIAGKNIADPTSLCEAIKLAARLS